MSRLTNNLAILVNAWQCSCEYVSETTLGQDKFVGGVSVWKYIFL